jgi:cation transport protein ChaC
VQLTKDLIAKAFQGPVADDPTVMPLLTPQELQVSRSAFFEQIPSDRDVWLFAYGSLMWKPDMKFVEQRLVRLLGWHRRFCIWQWRYRGTKTQPGLMMALDRGGSCVGVAYRISAPGVSDKLAKVWEREMMGRAYRPKWVKVRNEQAALDALAFVADPSSHRYTGRLDENIIATHIATACGQIGPSAEYLLETFLRCRELGIEDQMLSRMERLVATKIAERLET